MTRLAYCFESGELPLFSESAVEEHIALNHRVRRCLANGSLKAKNDLCTRPDCRARRHFEFKRGIWRRKRGKLP